MSKPVTTLLNLVLVSVVAFIGYSFYRVAMNTSLPRHAKLVTARGAVVSCSFTPRKAHGFSMLMVEQCQFTGRVQIVRAGQQVADFMIDSDRMKYSNRQLTTGVSQAWMLTADLYTNYHLQCFLAPGEEHQIVFSFPHPPVTNASIWDVVV